MKKSLYLAVIVAILIGGGVLIYKSDRVNAAGPYPLSGWAWSSNIGWISFNSTNPGAGTGSAYSVQMDDAGNLTGYAWSSNVGWVSFNPSSLSQSPACNGTTAAHVDTSTGDVVGWARAIVGVGRSDGWDGCIELTGVNHVKGDPTGNSGVYYNKTDGTLKGFSWSDAVIGWLSFMSSTYGVKIPYVAGISGSCTSSHVNPVTVGTSEAQITFTANSTGGTGTHTYTWSPEGVGNGDVVSASPYTFTYGAPGTYAPVVKVTDGVGNSTTLNCPNVEVDGTVVVGGPLQLYIGKNIDQANSASYTTEKGKPFALKWVNTLLASGYSCDTTVDNSGPWVDWGDTDSGSALKNVGNVPTGVYTFTINCRKLSSFVNTSIILKVRQSTEEEI